MVTSFLIPQYIMELAPTDILTFTIWYSSIRSMSDPQLDMQIASHFLRYTLVDQLYAIGVYFCSFVTKCNQACIKYSSKYIK